MKESISLLEAVLSTLDTIPIVGIDAQDKFVGCANAIRTVIRSIKEEYLNAPTSEEKEE